MTANGHRTLDLTDFVEAAHIVLPGLSFDLPLDLPLAMVGRMNRIGNKLQDPDNTSDEEYKQLEEDLWKLADDILAGAVPRPEKPAREILTLTALFRLIAFLTLGLRELRESNAASPSPTPTAEPSASQTSYSRASS